MSYKPSAELNALIEKLLGEETSQFFSCIADQLPHTIRFNTLKGEPEQLKNFLEEQGFQLECFPGFTDIYRLPYQPYPIGKTLSHFLGHFYVQDIASMLPARILQPRPGDVVLDMSAAPGSKTTQMAVMMQNQGMILANDIVQKRLRALINNLQRLGITNTAVVKSYGESLGNLYFEMFDKVLLDPACSGLGTLHKSPEVLSWWTPSHCARLASGQRSMISSAIKALKPGGILVYSTCTITPEENEEVIQYALREFPVDLVDLEIPELDTRPGLIEFDGKKYEPRLQKTRRLYPFQNQTEGFFIARLRKLQSLEKSPGGKQRTPVSTNFIGDRVSPVKKYLDYFTGQFGIPRDHFSRFQYRMTRDITAVGPAIASFPFKTVPLKTGLTIARPMTQIGKLTTEGSMLFGNAAQQNVVDLPDLNQLYDFVNRRNMEMPAAGQNQILVRYHGMTIGYGMIDHGKFKSQFPRAEWSFHFGEEKL